MKKIKTYLIRLVPFLLVLILSYSSIKELFLPGFYPMHDDTQVARVYTMYTALSDGMFPVRWVMDLGYGYGYPIFNFYAPLAYYVGALFMFLGVDALIATKLMIGTGVVFAGITMYLFAKQLWGVLGGLLAGILYVYAPYHALNVFVRGDIAEVWAYAFIPLVLYGLFAIYTVRQSEKNVRVWKYISLGAIGYAGVILSHNLTAMMITPFLIAFIGLLIVLLPKQKRLLATRHMVFVFLLGIVLAAFYWIPTFGEMQYTNVLSQIGGGADYKDHFVCPIQLLHSSWGFGGSTTGCVDGMSFKIGKLHVLLTLLFCVLLPMLYKKDKKQFTLSVLFFSFTVASIILMLVMSKPVWDTVPLMKFFQFPWRFLLITSLFTSVLGGGIVYLLQNIHRKVQKPVFIGGILICVYTVISYSTLFRPQTILYKTAKDYTSPHALRWVASKISDEYLPKGFKKPVKKEDIVGQRAVEIGSTDKTQQAEIQVGEEKTTKIDVVVKTPELTSILVKVAPFPGWRIETNPSNLKYDTQNNGVLFFIPEGKSRISFRFKQTPIELFANAVSIAGIAGILLGIIYERKARYGKNTS